MHHHLNYTEDFFNIHEASVEQFNTTKNDFCELLNILLNELGCDSAYATNISETLFCSMTNDRVFYHTPVHVMSMLYFAHLNKIPLRKTERLAIFFHDAIYRTLKAKTKSDSNEYQSVKFMVALLANTGIDHAIIHEAASIIENTADHLEDGLFQFGNTVMDLDLSGFASGVRAFRIQNECIEKEFCTDEIRSSPEKMRVFLTGRLAFLDKLNSRKSLYRTDWFIQNCEQRARMNLKNAITETKRRMELND